RPDDVVAAGSQVAQSFEDRLRLEEVALALVAIGKRSPPLLDLAAPGCGSRVTGARKELQLLRQLRERGSKRTDNGDVGTPQLPDLGRVDVEVDHLRARRE